jgi:diguanylate cyclase (GGDEF)-like protein/PAS domain S-box-containing protein
MNRDETVRVLLIEDLELEARLVRQMLASVGTTRFELLWADRVGRGLEILDGTDVDLILLDLNLPDSGGYGTFERVHGHAPGLPIILFTNVDDEAQAARAVREGAQDYLIKHSVDATLLSRAILYAIERQHSEAALRRSEERYALAVRGSSDGLWDWDLDSGELYFSPRWKAILGLAADHPMTALGAWLERVHPEDAPALRLALQRHLEGETEHLDCEYRAQHADGSWIWVSSRGVAVQDEAGRPRRMAGSLTDITTRKRYEERLVHDALHDSLTGLPNRTLLLDRIDLALKQAKRCSSARFAVLFLDLDRFKTINDSLGHHVGDRLLIQVARRLREPLRPGDTVARLGGDEFAILLTHIRSITNATHVAQRVLDALCRSFEIDGQEVSPLASIGIAVSSPEYQSPEEMLRDADIAMYRAKETGKARFEIFDEQMRSTALGLLELETELRRAVERGDFVLHYQPIVSLEQRRLVGLEALVRWSHPTKGLIPPNSFIPAAEETGLIVPLGWWTIQEACRQLQAWRETMPEARELSVAVNVSSRLFNQPDMVPRLLRILEETSLPPHLLTVEITEGTLLDHADAALLKLQALRALGIELHVDDFGTGYSSLSYLQKFEYDTLKIDGSFVRDISESEGSDAIVQSIITLGRLLERNVIAEGVETVEQLRRLVELRCPCVQGFWFSEPLEAEELTALLRRPTGWTSRRLAGVGLRPQRRPKAVELAI